MADIILKSGREKSVLRHHPWIFSGAVNRIVGEPGAGETVNVLSSNREFLAKAAYNPNSNIIGRIWSWDINQVIDPSFFSTQINKAISYRHDIRKMIHSDAIRLIHGESDGLPGLILDQYHDVFVVQFLTFGTEYWKNVLCDLIVNITGAKVLYERSDQDVRELEGLPLRKGILYGNLIHTDVNIVENKLKFIVDIENGQKTGYYLDQKENHLYVRLLSKDLKVLDCFSYSGAFGINALAGEAVSVVFADTSSSALELAKKNLQLNAMDISKTKFIEQDIFKYLRSLRDEGARFDLIILDPPKFAPTIANVDQAARGYKDINLLALKLLNKGGYLFTFSCSGGVDEVLFQKIIAGAALDAVSEIVIMKRLHQAVDHPVALNFPEGAYLKGFIIQKRN